MKIKKIIGLLFGLFFILLIIAFGLIYFLCNKYEYKELKDGWTMWQNVLTKECFVGTYEWDGNKDKTDIYVPNTYEGRKVECLGGNIGVPGGSFGIGLGDKFLEGGNAWGTIDIDDEPTDKEYETLNFTIHIGENITKIENCFGPSYYVEENTDDTRYKINYYFECSKKNTYFYSENGILYSKKENKPIFKQ